MQETPLSTLRVVLTDDHHIVRHAIKTILNSADGYEVVGEAENAEDTVKLVEQEKPDILVLDIGLPKKSGIEVLLEIKQKNLPTKVMVLSMYDDEAKIKQSLAGGARCYLLKNAPPEEFLKALNQVREGEIYLPPRFQHLKGWSGSNGAEAKKRRKKGADESDPLAELSPRERQMFFLLAEGLPNRVIAKQLFISPRTVETHRARVIRKLGLKSNADLIRFAIRNGLIVL